MRWSTSLRTPESMARVTGTSSALGVLGLMARAGMHRASSTSRPGSSPPQRRRPSSFSRAERARILAAVTEDRVEVFLSCTAADDGLRAELRTHLRPLERDGVIVWDAPETGAGSE